MTGTRPTDNWEAAVERVKATGKGWEALLYHAARLLREGRALPPPLADFIAGGLDEIRETEHKGAAKLFGCHHARGRRGNASRGLKRAIDVEILMRMTGVSQIQAAAALTQDDTLNNKEQLAPSTWVRAHDDHKEDACAIIASGKPEGPEPRPIDWLTESEEKAARIAKRMKNRGPNPA
ncbi:hypothetical protein [Thioalkalivibrio sp. ALJ16]|uniref:hypothetical protein n=1 Tax=Thioalkalivibrio sp. ALJ16 TaxID=1158762 RepID=UPI000375BCA4|nr:hypothetical protein [Thioalkalivibrio sp. ALJ16]